MFLSPLMCLSLSASLSLSLSLSLPQAMEKNVLRWRLKNPCIWICSFLCINYSFILVVWIELNHSKSQGRTLLLCRQKVKTAPQPSSNLCNLLGAQTAKGAGLSPTDNHTICLSHYQVWMLHFTERTESLMLWPNSLGASEHTKIQYVSPATQKKKKNLSIPWAY